MCTDGGGDRGFRVVGEDRTFRHAPEMAKATLWRKWLGGVVVAWLICSGLQYFVDPSAAKVTLVIVTISLSVVSTFLTILTARYLVESDFVLDAIILQMIIVVALIVGFAMHYHETQGIVDAFVLIEDRHVPTTFGDAVYFSTVTISTLGYGDIQPRPSHRTVAAIEAVIGVIHVGLLVSLFLAFSPVLTRARHFKDAYDNLFGGIGEPKSK